MLTEGVDFLGTTQESPIEIISETGAEEEKNVPSIFRLRIRFKLGRIIINTLAFKIWIDMGNYKIRAREGPNFRISHINPNFKR